MCVLLQLTKKDNFLDSLVYVDLNTLGTGMRDDLHQEGASLMTKHY